MFERFNQGARLTIFRARDVANRLGSDRIETAHLLLGILADDPLVAGLLDPASSREIRLQFEQGTPNTSELLPGPDLPLSEESKCAVTRAAEEADRMQDREIGNEHILVGLLLEKSCRAAQLLTRNGVVLETVRKQIESLR